MIILPTFAVRKHTIEPDPQRNDPRQNGRTRSTGSIKRERMSDSGENAFSEGSRILRGTVTEGNRIGRRLGFPTANIAAERLTDVSDGVYAAAVSTQGRTYRAVVNVGRRPTVGDGMERTLEAHLIGFAGDLYGKTIAVRILGRIREEKKFASLEALRRQIECDRRRVEEMPQEAFAETVADGTTAKEENR